MKDKERNTRTKTTRGNPEARIIQKTLARHGDGRNLGTLMSWKPDEASRQPEWLSQFPSYMHAGALLPFLVVIVD